jgi:lambda family phage portal protein
MGILADAIAKVLGRKPRRSATAFPAAQVSRLTNSWTNDPGAVNRWARHELRTLRARSRQLARAEGYAAKFVGSCVANVAGPKPFVLQAKVKRPRGSPDVAMNARIEQLWREFGRRGRCDATGNLSLAMLHRLILRTLARDGEAMIRILNNGRAGMRLQILDIDRLDEEKNEDLGARGAIKMGVEVDPDGMPVAYHILRKHPGEVGYWGGNNVREYERVPAAEILHLFVPEYPEQVRGIPWMAAAMMRMWNLGGFEEAAVINARVGASKMGFYVSPDGDLPATLADAKDATTGRFVQDAEPGAFDVLPTGYDFKSWDPQFPDAAVEPFIRTSLRGIAAGLGVAYHSLANDPSNVNYSTARVALLEERDTWMALQEWYVEQFCEPLYRAWLDAEQLAGTLPRDERLLNVRWACKRWAWVDPLKETQAQTAALAARLTSRTRILMESGEDFEDILAEIAQEEQLAEAMGVELEPATEPEAPEPTEPPEPEHKETEDESERRLRLA